MSAPPFVDPRNNPSPPALPAASCERHKDVAALVKLCREGRIYAVEAWIRDGRPLYATEVVTRGRRPESALSVAVEARQYDLSLLLLCNGFPANPPGERLLSRVLSAKLLPFVELLLAWGADPLAVDAYDVLDTYDADLYDRFSAFGLDLTRDHALAFELARHSSNRPAYGWAKRNATNPRIARELAAALCDAIEEDKERAVALLLWAGADPHLKAPSLRFFKHGQPDDPESDESAVEIAIRRGRGKYLPKLKPDPAVDDLQLLWRSVDDVETLDCLVKIAPPADWSQTIVHAIHRLTWGFSTSYQVRAAIERMFMVYKAKVTTLDPQGIARLRRAILSLKNDYEFLPVLRFLAKPEHCEPLIFGELMRTTSMRVRFGGRGIKGVLAPAQGRMSGQGSWRGAR